MTAARAKIATLRRQVRGLHFAGTARAAARLPLGPAALDRALGGGLLLAALHEAEGPGAAAFAVALAGRLPAPAIWIASADLGAILYPCALNDAGLSPETVIFIRAPARQTAWALEQALRSGAARVAVAEATLPPDFTASRRLQLAARESGATALLATSEPRRNRPPASAAETRWRIAPSLSVDPWAPPRFTAELLKNKSGPLGKWEIEQDETSHRFRLAAPA